LQNALVFLVETYLKLVLDDFHKVNHYDIDFCNVYVELHGIDAEVEITLKQEIIKLVKLSTTKSVGDVGFSSSWISIRTGGLTMSE